MVNNEGKKIDRRGWIPVVILALLVYSGCDTTHGPAKIDYLFNYFGVEAWSGNNHIAARIWIIPIIIALILVIKISAKKYNIRGGLIFLGFVAVMFVTYKTDGWLKSNNIFRDYGLNTIEYVDGENKLSCNIRDGELIEINGSITLVNYGAWKQNFKIRIPIYDFDDKNIEKMIILRRFDGSDAIFTIEPGQKRTIYLGENEIKAEVTGDKKSGISYSMFDVDKVIIVNNYEKKELDKIDKGISYRF